MKWGGRGIMDVVFFFFFLNFFLLLWVARRMWFYEKIIEHVRLRNSKNGE